MPMPMSQQPAWKPNARHASSGDPRKSWSNVARNTNDPNKPNNPNHLNNSNNSKNPRNKSQRKVKEHAKESGGVGNRITPRSHMVREGSTADVQTVVRGTSQEHTEDVKNGQQVKEVPDVQLKGEVHLPQQDVEELQPQEKSKQEVYSPQQDDAEDQQVEEDPDRQLLEPSESPTSTTLPNHPDISADEKTPQKLNPDARPFVSELEEDIVWQPGTVALQEDENASRVATQREYLPGQPTGPEVQGMSEQDVIKFMQQEQLKFRQQQQQLQQPLFNQQQEQFPLQQQFDLPTYQNQQTQPLQNGYGYAPQMHAQMWNNGAGNPHAHYGYSSSSSTNNFGGQENNGLSVNTPWMGVKRAELNAGRKLVFACKRKHTCSIC